MKEISVQKEGTEKGYSFESFAECFALLSAAGLSTTLGYFRGLGVPIYPSVEDSVIFYLSSLIFSLFNSDAGIMLVLLIIVLIMLGNYLVKKGSMSLRKTKIFNIIALLLFIVIEIFIMCKGESTELREFLTGNIVIRLSSFVFIGALAYYIYHYKNMNKKLLVIIAVLHCLLNYYLWKNYSGIVKTFTTINFEKNDMYTEKLLWSDSSNLITVHCLRNSEYYEVVWLKESTAISLGIKSNKENPAFCNLNFIAARDKKTSIEYFQTSKDVKKY